MTQRSKERHSQHVPGRRGQTWGGAAEGLVAGLPEGQVHLTPPCLGVWTRSSEAVGILRAFEEGKWHHQISLAVMWSWEWWGGRNWIHRLLGDRTDRTQWVRERSGGESKVYNLGAWQQIMKTEEEEQVSWGKWYIQSWHAEFAKSLAHWVVLSTRQLKYNSGTPGKCGVKLLSYRTCLKPKGKEVRTGHGR